MNLDCSDFSHPHPCRGAEKCAIVIASCDAYADTWAPFHTLFERFWPDCPFPAFLISNRQAINSSRIQNIRVGDDVSWSDNLHVALSQIEQEFVLLMVDDLFLTNRVRTDSINRLFEWMQSTEANCIHLFGRPRPARRCTDLVGPLPKGTYYRASAVSSLWRREVLSGILKSGESAWDFEIYGTRRSNGYDGFYSVLTPCFSFINALIKGRWDPSALAALGELGVFPDTARRGILNLNERTALRLVKVRSALLRLLPLAVRAKVKDYFLGSNYQYRSYAP